jgi:hypothetical protein
MATALGVLSLIAAGLPLAEEIFDSIKTGIEAVNKTKVAGAKLTAEQAAAANASATQIAQVSLASKVSSGKIAQAAVSAAIPDAKAFSALVEMSYQMPLANAAAKPVASTGSISPAQQALLNALVAAILNPA